MRKYLLGAALLLLFWGVAVAATGGVDVKILGIALRSRDPFRPIIAGLALTLVASMIYRAESAALLDRVGAAIRRHAAALVLAAAAGLTAHAVVFGSFVAGGSDPFGYVSQAYDWASGRLPRPIPLPLSLPFETADEMQAPLGYRVGVDPHTMVPTYAPGLPLLMAAALLAGACGPFFVVPFFAAVFVWMTYRLGSIAGGHVNGVVAAAVLVTCPVVLYQAVWPMNDIPAGALWTAAIVSALGASRRGVLTAGLWTAAGLLVRPNLVLVPLVPLLLVFTGASGAERWRRAAIFCAPIVPVVVFVAVLNTLWYGSPSNSGYGAAREIYGAGNVWPNLRLYASWLWESQPWGAFIALLPLVPALRPGLDRRALAGCALMFAVTVASYVAYAQFEAWWYLRFLMPAYGALAVLIASGLIAIARAVPQPFGRVAAASVLCLMMATTVTFAARKDVFGGLRQSELRYADIGGFADSHLPANAILFATQHSGSLRYYAGRLTLRFDSVRKEWAPAVPSAIERAGYRPYLVVDDFEIPQVREQFGLASDAPLPWPIVARMRELGGVAIYDMATSPAAQAPIALEPADRHTCEARRR